MTDPISQIKAELERMFEVAKPCDGEFTNDSYYKTQLDLATKALSVAVTELEYYALAKNLEIENRGNINFDDKFPEWRIGQPYLKHAEMGQKASNALKSIAEILSGGGGKNEKRNG